LSKLTHADIRLKVIEEIRKAIKKSVLDIKRISELSSSEIEELNHYNNIVESGIDIPLIIKNERPLESGGIPDIEIFGGRLIIEVKKHESEFRKGRTQIEDYIKYYPTSQYVIVTNYEKWEVSKVNQRIPLGWAEKEESPVYDIIREMLIEGIKIQLSTENISNMFEFIKSYERQLLSIFFCTYSRYRHNQSLCL